MVCNSASPHLMDPKGLVVTKNAYFSLLMHIKQLLFVTFCDTISGIEASFSIRNLASPHLTEPRARVWW